MRLKKEQVTQIAHQLVDWLKNIGCVLKAEEWKILARIEAVFQKNMAEEFQIEEEVKTLMERYRSQVASGEVDPQKAYQMIKRQVAKEKKFIL